jgi:hypothetical protein
VVAAFVVVALGLLLRLALVFVDVLLLLPPPPQPAMRAALAATARTSEPVPRFILDPLKLIARRRPSVAAADVGKRGNSTPVGAAR